MPYLRPDRLIFVCALPLYHIYALTVNALMGMQQGAQNILIPNPRDIPGYTDLPRSASRKLA